jgi:hypothetical protein
MLVEMETIWIFAAYSSLSEREEERGNEERKRKETAK